MPLLLLNWRRIAELWIQGMQDSFSAKEQGEAVKPLLECVFDFLFHATFHLSYANQSSTRY